MSAQIQHRSDSGDYVRLALLVGALSTVGGALGSALESDKPSAGPPTVGVVEHVMDEGGIHDPRLESARRHAGEPEETLGRRLRRALDWITAHV